MNPGEPAFVKCECIHCSGHLEFDRAYAGSLVECPHCHQDTRLSLPSPPERTAPRPPCSVPDHLAAPAALHWRYAGTGGEIRLGDRVSYRGTYATVVVVSDGLHCRHAPGYSEYEGIGEMVVICDDEGMTHSLREVDERLKLLHH